MKLHICPAELPLYLSGTVPSVGVSAGLFLRYLYLPPGPTAVGSGGILRYFDSFSRLLPFNYFLNRTPPLPLPYPAGTTTQFGMMD
jgi:hypothetical protein